MLSQPLMAIWSSFFVELWVLVYEATKKQNIKPAVMFSCFFLAG